MSTPDMQRAKHDEVATELMQQLLASSDEKSAATQVLRDELLARGVPAKELDAIGSQQRRRKRLADSQPDPLIAIGAIGRIVTILIALPTFLLLQYFVGQRAAFAGVLVVVALYLLVLIPRVRTELRLPLLPSTRFWLTWQCVEGVIVLLILSMPVLFTVV